MIPTVGEIWLTRGAGIGACGGGATQRPAAVVVLGTSNGGAEPVCTVRLAPISFESACATSHDLHVWEEGDQEGEEDYIIELWNTFEVPNTCLQERLDRLPPRYLEYIERYLREGCFPAADLRDPQRCVPIGPDLELLRRQSPAVVAHYEAFQKRERSLVQAFQAYVWREALTVPEEASVQKPQPTAQGARDLVAAALVVVIRGIRRLAAPPLTGKLALAAAEARAAPSWHEEEVAGLHVSITEAVAGELLVLVEQEDRPLAEVTVHLEEVESETKTVEHAWGKTDARGEVKLGGIDALPPPRPGGRYQVRLEPPAALR